MPTCKQIVGYSGGRAVNISRRSRTRARAVAARGQARTKGGAGEHCRRGSDWWWQWLTSRMTPSISNSKRALTRAILGGGVGAHSATASVCCSECRVGHRTSDGGVDSPLFYRLAREIMAVRLSGTLVLPTSPEENGTLRGRCSAWGDGIVKQESAPPCARTAPRRTAPPAKPAAGGGGGKAWGATDPLHAG